MSAMYVCWRAAVRSADAGAPVRLARVVEELDAYPKILAPVVNWEPGDRLVCFGFWVEGLAYAPAAESHARRALDVAFRSALVGAPDPPVGVRHVALAVELEDHPTIRHAEAGS